MDTTHKQWVKGQAECLLPGLFRQLFDQVAHDVRAAGQYTPLAQVRHYRFTISPFPTDELGTVFTVERRLPGTEIDPVAPALPPCIDRGHGLHLFGDMVNTLPCMASPQKEERHALERGVDHVSTSRIHAVSPAAGGLPPRPLSPVRDQPHHRL